MAYDLVALVLVALFGVLGYQSGFLKQAARIGALVAAFLFARGLAGPLGAWARGSVGASDEGASGAAVAQATAFLGLLVVAYVALVLLANALIRRLRKASGTVTAFDRALGALFGTLKGAALVFLAACALVWLDEPLSRHAPWLAAAQRDSLLGRTAARHNVVRSEIVPRAAALHNLARLAQGERLRDDMLQHLRLVQILSHPNAAVLREPALQAAIREGRFADVLTYRDGRILALIEDRDLANLIAALEFESAPGQPAPPLPGPAPAAPPGPAPIRGAKVLVP